MKLFSQKTDGFKKAKQVCSGTANWIQSSRTHSEKNSRKWNYAMWGLRILLDGLSENLYDNNQKLKAWWILKQKLWWLLWDE